jgi:hypothetical protein
MEVTEKPYQSSGKGDKTEIAISIQEADEKLLASLGYKQVRSDILALSFPIPLFDAKEVFDGAKRGVGSNVISACTPPHGWTASHGYGSLSKFQTTAHVADSVLDLLPFESWC